MLQRSEFSAQRQFHLLINFKDDERSIAVLPNDEGNFLVVDQGKVLAQLDFDRQLNCVSVNWELDENILAQLNSGIRDHYYS